jgi:hypothetical protein
MASAAEGGGGGGAAAAARKVDVILLAEMHGSAQCAIRNFKILNDYLMTAAKRLGSPAAVFRSTLLFSEGRGGNACYHVLRFPADRIMQEHGAEQTKIEQLDRFLLYLELLNSSALGKDISGLDPSGQIVNLKWFMERAEHDGYKPMLDAIPEGKKLCQRMVIDAILHKTADYEAKLRDFLTKIMEHFLTDASDGALIAMLTRVRDIPVAEQLPVLKQIYGELRERRDADVVRCISERVSEEGTVETVFLIFGAAHYENLVRLIAESPNLKLSPLSTGTYMGGRRRRSRTHRKTHLRRRGRGTRRK